MSWVVHGGHNRSAYPSLHNRLELFSCAQLLLREQTCFHCSARPFSIEDMPEQDNKGLTLRFQPRGVRQVLPGKLMQLGTRHAMERSIHSAALEEDCGSDQSVLWPAAHGRPREKDLHAWVVFSRFKLINRHIFAKLTAKSGPWR